MTGRSRYQYDVFVSYSRKDIDKVQRVVDGLREHGLKVWLDKDEIGPGEPIRKRVFTDAIPASAVVMVFISRRSLASEFVANEIDAAMWREMDAQRVVVVPVLLGNVSVDDLPSDLRGKAFYDLTHSFERKWRAERTQIITSMAALVRGEARTGGEVIVRVGDPLIRFFNNYWFKRRNETQAVDRLREDEMNTVARAIAQAAVSNWRRADAAEDEQSTQDETAQRSSAEEEFIQRYGEYSLQQMALYFLDVGKISLTGGFQMEEMAELMDKIMLLVAIYSLYFTFEALKATHAHHILVKMVDTSFEVRFVGRMTDTEGRVASNEWLPASYLTSSLYV